MPLAFKLAAAGVRALSPQQIAARLGDRFPAARRLVSGYAGWRSSLGGEGAPLRLAGSLKASGFRLTRTPQAMVTSPVGMVFTRPVRWR
jgi:hypothetical protein